jgi:hypothetical protein
LLTTAYLEKALGTISPTDQFNNASSNASSNDVVKTNGGDTAIPVAIIAAIGAVIAAVVSGVFALISQKKLKELELMKMQKDAWLTYKYNARNRLYEECEPILYQFYELSLDAFSRISHLPMRAKEGKLKGYVKSLPQSPEEVSRLTKEEEIRRPHEEEEEIRRPHEEEEEIRRPHEEDYHPKSTAAKGWLSTKGYYMLSTIYYLLAPLAAFKLLQNSQNRLTRVDLAIDPTINTIYILAKHLYRTFDADHKLAEQKPRLYYEGYEQGIFHGYLDNMTEALIEYYNEPERTPRLRSFGRFTKKYFKKKDNEYEILPPFDQLYELLLNFHPQTKPVVWRILIAQLYLYDAIKNIYEKPKDRDRAGSAKDFKPIKPRTYLQNRADFDWRRGNEATDMEVLNDPFNAVESYLRNVLSLGQLME